MIVVFAVALSFAGRQLNRFLVEAIRLRFQLHDADLRLKAEILERQATEEVLRQAQKLNALGQLTGGIAHDFNNLLTVVIGNLTLAIGRAGDNQADARLLQGAWQAAERGVALVRRLLAFTRKQRLDPRSVDIGALVGSIEDLLRRTSGRSIQVSIATAADLAPARVAANQLELAILNQTINARDAMPGGGTLQLCSKPLRRRRRAPRAAVRHLCRGVDQRHRKRMDETTLARSTNVNMGIFWFATRVIFR
jgi:signal transduction histidine kinase